MFDIGALEFLVLGIAALFIFGPDRLPGMARQAARGLRQLRDLATNARRDLSKELGPEFEDFDLRDLNPKQFVQKHVLNDIDEDDLRIDKDLDVSKDLRVDIDEDRSKRRTNGSSSKTSTNGTSTKTSSSQSTSTSEDDPDDVVDSVDSVDSADSVDDAVVESVSESASVPANGSASKVEPPPPFDPDAT